MILRILALSFLLLANCAHAQTVYDAHTTVDFITQSKTIKPGQSFLVGLRMKLDPGWHVYWKNPGDSGLPPKIQWQLPEGFSAGPILWPVPVRIEAPPLASFGYENEVILLTEIQTPPGPYNSEALKAKVDWLACEVDCIPGRAELALKIPVVSAQETFDPAIKAIFDQAQKYLPQSMDDWKITASQNEESIVIDFSSPKILGVTPLIRFFPEESGVIENAAPQILNTTEDGYTITLKKSHLSSAPVNRIKGVVAYSGYGFNVDIDQISQTTSVPTGNSLNLFLACVFAFIGGLILNVMPCVLPVLSIKVLSLLNHQDHKKMVLHGAAFSSGVVISFWVLAALLLIFKTIGYKIGWGFQFQSPGFVIFISIVLFLLALNLFGLFEIGTSLTTLGTSQSSQRNLLGSFLSGILATVVATPCTAPFMGTALGFALSQNAIVSFLVFTSLGLGMAMPFFALCAFPQFLRFVPKPGAWMVRLKVSFGFVLLACNIWLVWVLGVQRNIEAVGTLLIAFLFLSVAAWIFGLKQQHALSRLKASLLMAVFLGLAIAVVLKPESKPIEWIPYSLQAFQEARQGKRPIFIDFTAAWCLSCQVNDRLVLQNKEVAEALSRHQVVMFKADWTNYDEAITQALARYGRKSIPLYVYYPQPAGAPVILPELITRESILDVLNKQY